MPPFEPPLTDSLPLDAPQRLGAPPHPLAPSAPAVGGPSRARPPDVAARVVRARDAQDTWGHTPLAERVKCLLGAAREMLQRRQEVMQLVEQEIGKVHAEALFTEALGPLDAVKGWASVLRPALARRKVRLNPLGFPGKRAQVEAVPRGVIAIIAPWNFPVAGLYRSVFPALMSGNAIVLKPSEYSPRSSGWFAELLAAHLPAGLVQVAHGDGAVGAALLEARPDACVFTGSPATGRKVSIRCAELGIPCSAEMGGKDPAIVLADCDLERTVAGITHWALCNAGQACGAIEIAYVERSIADAFVARMAEVWKELRAGTDVAPLANARQLAVVREHIDDALARGATAVSGGAPLGQGLGFAPTLLDRCDDTMSVVRDETFGPVLAVVRVEGPAEAIRAANQLRYGLGASIWTADLARGQRLAERLDYGVVSVNNHSFTGAVPSLPWSGTRATGFGVANSALALSTFVRPRAVVVDRRKDLELYWMPYDETLVELGDVLADLQQNRLGRAWKLPGLIRRRMRALRAFFRRRRSGEVG